MTNKIFIIVVGLDIEGYTNKTLHRQINAQKKLEACLIEACLTSQIADSHEKIKWIDTGDGGFLIFETKYAKAMPFLESFFSRLKEENTDIPQEHIIKVRAAVHCADVDHWQGKLGDKYAGNAINICARILDGMQRQYSNQVVCSGEYIRKVCGDESKLVEELRLPDYIDKHKKPHEVWNMLKKPGFGIQPNEEDLHENPNKWRL